MNLLGVISGQGSFFRHGKSERDTECVRVGADYKAGSAGMRYNNVGKMEMEILLMSDSFLWE